MSPAVSTSTLAVRVPRHYEYLSVSDPVGARHAESIG